MNRRWIYAQRHGPRSARHVTALMVCISIACSSGQNETLQATPGDETQPAGENGAGSSLAENGRKPQAKSRPSRLPALPEGEEIDPVELKTYVEQLNRLVRRLDPTGTLEKAHEREQAITDAGQAASEGLKRIDYEGLNQSIVELRKVIDMLHTRIAGIPDDTGRRLAAQIDAADVEEISAKLKALINEANRKIQRLPVEETDRVVRTLQGSLDRVEQALAELDIQAINRSVDRTTGPLVVMLWLACGLLGVLTLYWVLRLLRPGTPRAAGRREK